MDAWLVVSTHLKNISQIGSFPQVGMKITNIWNHHPDAFLLFFDQRFFKSIPKVICWSPSSVQRFKCFAPERLGELNAWRQLCLRSWFTGHQRNQSFVSSQLLLVNAHDATALRSVRWKKWPWKKQCCKGPASLSPKKKTFCLQKIIPGSCRCVYISRFCVAFLTPKTKSRPKKNRCNHFTYTPEN